MTVGCSLQACRCSFPLGFAPRGGRGAYPGILAVELGVQVCPGAMTSPGSGCVACEGVWKTAHGASMFKCIVQGMNILGAGIKKQKIFSTIQPTKIRRRGGKQSNCAHLSSVIVEIQRKVGESIKMSEYSNSGSGGQKN